MIRNGIWEVYRGAKESKAPSAYLERRRGFGVSGGVGRGQSRLGVTGPKFVSILAAMKSAKHDQIVDKEVSIMNREIRSRW